MVCADPSQSPCSCAITASRIERICVGITEQRVSHAGRELETANCLLHRLVDDGVEHRAHAEQEHLGADLGTQPRVADDFARPRAQERDGYDFRRPTAVEAGHRPHRRPFAHVLDPEQDQRVTYRRDLLLQPEGRRIDRAQHAHRQRHVALDQVLEVADRQLWLVDGREQVQVGQTPRRQRLGARAWPGGRSNSPGNTCSPHRAPG